MLIKIRQMLHSDFEIVLALSVQQNMYSAIRCFLAAPWIDCE